MERGGARVERRARRHDVVDEDEMQATKRRAIRACTERAGNVAGTLPWCQPRLRRRRTRTLEQILAHWYAPPRRECSRKKCALVESALTLTGSGQRSGHEG